MAVLLGVLRPLAWIIDRVLAACRVVAVALLALMVLAILVQVFFRYGLGHALAWPEEAARFGMLWMTGLMAPLAYRRGGFVAIDMAERALPPRLGAALGLLLTLVSLGVLLYALPLGSAHVQSGCLFTSNTLWVPFTLELGVPLPGTGLALTLCSDAPSLSVTPGWTKLPLAATYASLYVGLQLLLLVNVELLLRAVVALLGGEDRLPAMLATDMASAE
jgi:TRAP-type C4-dicarboxylate transport system permease small subunit